MAGAKGVIISIIGGEDMKLLEVDEAANHIRELVDEDANIIWGSAFNPDLHGKIRVSVVATGIDGSEEAVGTSHVRTSYTMESRPPRRPALDLPREAVQEDEPFELSEGLSAGQDDDEPLPELTPPYNAYEELPEEQPMELTAADFAEVDETEADTEEPALSRETAYGGDAEDGEDFDDVDDIVDPLAGLRNEHTERFERGEYTDDDQSGAMSGVGAETEAGADDELDLGASDYGNPLQPKRRQPIIPGGNAGTGAGGGGAVPPGNTLFERMANLSRGTGGSRAADEEDEDDGDDAGGSTLNIPRFLGRQNNQ